MGQHHRNPRAIAKARGELEPRPKQGQGLPWSTYTKGERPKANTRRRR